MAKQVWLCGTCGAQHPSEEKALECEARHPDPKTFEIVGATFRSMNGAYGAEVHFRARVPGSIKVRFSDERGDFAVYNLERHGPRGV